MAYGIEGLIDVTQSSFFVYILPWLLTFALVFGILEHYKIPKSKSARTIISLVIAFFVMPVAAPVVAILGQLGLGMVILFAGILFILILFEVTGTKNARLMGTGKGREAKLKKIRVTETYYKLFGFAVAVLAVMVFLGAGGLEYLGYEMVNINYPLVFFIGILVIMIWWMVREGDEQ